ncbi:MAG TPA: agmatine deiminase family protein [Rhodanobacteraceae bacterium]|nr:agmatine deiminase family protein [Rhodanobacteraceae bacterium]
MDAASFRLPAEWQPQAAIAVAWPHENTDWAARLAEVETSHVALVGAIARFEPVLVCVASPGVRHRAARLLEAAGVDAARLRFVEIPYDDTWLRDSGPVTLTDGRRFRVCDFRFTGWGGKFESGRDDRLVSELVAHRVFRDAEYSRIDWALEGGAIESDGAGTLLTTWRCLHQRHPDASRATLTRELERHLGAKRVLWLEHGALEGDDTDAHIDTLARFAPNDSIVFQACDDRSDSHYAELALMRDELAALQTGDGRRYRLHPLPWPQPIVDQGRRLAASYANYLVVNGGVLVPAYGDPADAQARLVVATAHPGRDVVGIPCRPLIWQNGSLHCLTMQLPAGSLALDHTGSSPPVATRE